MSGANKAVKGKNVSKPPPAPKGRGTGKLLASLSALLLIMWGYVLLGATAFMFIEGTFGKEQSSQPQPSKLVDGVLEKLVELHEQNFTTPESTFKSEVEKVLRKHENKELIVEDKWTYQASLLFAASLVTTVGYGNIAAETSPGRLFTIVYSVVGIPLTLVCIGMLGTIMARGFKAVVFFLFEDVVTEEGEPYIPLKVSLGIMFSYLFLGAILFHSVEQKWTFLESFYFCFITLSTIGLGDFVYGEEKARDSNFVASVVYLLFGLSLLSMCFSLIEEQAAYQLYQCITLVLRKARAIKAMFTAEQEVQQPPVVDKTRELADKTSPAKLV